MKRALTKKASILALAGALLALVASVAYGAIPSADGTITACVDQGGDLKLIDAETGATCKNKQTLTWNQQGPAGSAGPAGDDGAPGADGQDGVSGREVIFATTAVDSIAVKTAHAVCPTGKVPVGGGGRPVFSGNEPNPDGFPPLFVAVQQSYPTSSGWFVYAGEMNATDSNWFLRAYVICAAAS